MEIQNYETGVSMPSTAFDNPQISDADFDNLYWISSEPAEWVTRLQMLGSGPKEDIEKVLSIDWLQRMVDLGVLQVRGARRGDTIIREYRVNHDWEPKKRKKVVRSRE